MDDAHQITLILKLLIELRAENFALRKALEQSGPMGAAGLDALIDVQRRHLLGLPTISYFLQNPQEKHLATPLDTLLTRCLEELLNASPVDFEESTKSLGVQAGVYAERRSGRQGQLPPSDRSAQGPSVKRNSQPAARSKVSKLK